MTNYEYIDSYLANELTEAEKNAFEQKLITNTELAEDYALYTAINGNKLENTQYQKDELSFRQNVATISTGYTNQNTTKAKGKLRKIIYIGLAAAAMLIVVFIVVPMGNTKATPNQLFATNYTYQTITETTRGESADTILNTAIAQYNTKNFEGAIANFNKIKASNALANFWLGVSKLELNDTKGAMAEFDILIAGTSVYKDKAAWYKALTYLKMSDIAICKKQLLTINNYSSYYKVAQQLLGEL